MKQYLIRLGYNYLYKINLTKFQDLFMGFVLIEIITIFLYAGLDVEFNEGILKGRTLTSPGN